MIYSQWVRTILLVKQPMQLKIRCNSQNKRSFSQEDWLHKVYNSNVRWNMTSILVCCSVYSSTLTLHKWYLDNGGILYIYYLIEKYTGVLFESSAKNETTSGEFTFRLQFILCWSAVISTLANLEQSQMYWKKFVYLHRYNTLTTSVYPAWTSNFKSKPLLL